MVFDQAVTMGIGGPAAVGESQELGQATCGQTREGQASRPDTATNAGLEREMLGPMAEWVTITQRVWSCGRQLRRWLSEQLGPWKLSDSEFLLLFSCGQSFGEGLAQQDLSGSLGISAARVSNHVDQLARRDLIRVERPPRDRRRQIIRLAPAGAKLVAEVLSRLAPAAAQLEQTTASDQRQPALEWLSHCRRAAG